MPSGDGDWSTIGDQPVVRERVRIDQHARGRVRPIAHVQRRLVLQAAVLVEEQPVTGGERRADLGIVPRGVSRSRISLRRGACARNASVTAFCAAIQLRTCGEASDSSQRYGSATRMPPRSSTCVPRDVAGYERRSRAAALGTSAAGAATQHTGQPSRLIEDAWLARLRRSSIRLMCGVTCAEDAPCVTIPSSSPAMPTATILARQVGARRVLLRRPRRRPQEDDPLGRRSELRRAQSSARHEDGRSRLVLPLERGTRAPSSALPRSLARRTRTRRRSIPRTRSTTPRASATIRRGSWWTFEPSTRFRGQ